MKETINIGGNPVELQWANYDEVIDVEAITKINPSNLFGEIVTVTAAAAKFGSWKAKLQEDVDSMKLDIKILIANITNTKRAEAASSAKKEYSVTMADGTIGMIKATESGLKEVYLTDPDYVEAARDLIQLERELAQITSVHWSIQSKCRNLNGAVSPTTPSEFVAGIIEERINTISIKK